MPLSFISMKKPLLTLLTVLVPVVCSITLRAETSLGLDVKLVVEAPAAGAFPLVKSERISPLWCDANDHKGVIRAVGDLQADIERVTGRKAIIANSRPASATPVIIGTIGKSAAIDSLIASGKLDVSGIKGKWESFVITTLNQPAPGIEQALVIAGSDKRGTIYGIYELSEQIGVSPWYWWADVPPARRDELLILPGAHVQGPPVVKYRGIFINDEEPGLGNWSREKFGGINSKMYVHMYELLLRLRANYLWPAMWGKTLFEDDPESARLADEYGIVMGTSHHEPMMRAHKDWTKRRDKIGNGKWNYATNTEGLREFFREGIDRAKNFENLVTIGMRGDGDEPMAGDDDMPANIALLEKVVSDQRKILADLVNPDVTRVPQVWSLYKEVADYYENGMKVPDDVTLLWCDDNWGNIRRLPTATERKRSGGAGVYYHFDYVGSPRSYKWINTNPLPKIWEQMNLAAEYEATRVWIVNVGDLKPMELPIEFFLRMAWNPKALPKEQIANWTRRWAEREFGATHASEIAELVSLYAKYNGWRKPELLAADTFSFVNYGEADRVQAAWLDLETRALRVGAALPAQYRDAYYQLVEYPVVACSTVARLHIATGRNRLHAAQGRISSAEQAQLVRDLFRRDQELTDAYHNVAGGKWNKMMSQTRIGFTTWSDPKTNILPELAEPAPAPNQVFGVAVEGSKLAWPGTTEAAALPPFDSVGRQRRWIDVFRRSAAEVSFTATASQPWIKLAPASGKLGADQRIQVEIDWAAAPLGKQEAYVTIARAGGEAVRVRIDALRSDQFPRTAKNTFFGALTGPVAIDAAAFSANTPAAGVRWETIPDYGRGAAGVSVFPVTSASIEPGAPSPTLEYPVLISRAGEIPVEFITGVALDFLPGRGVRFAVSLNDQPPRVVDLFAGQTYADPTKRGDKSSPAIRSWHDWVRNNAISVKSTVTVDKPGIHTLKVRVVDPGVVLQKIIVHTGEVRPSYFGPVAE
jgi:hypothetical protein